jgi:hypothetical protein
MELPVYCRATWAPVHGFTFAFPRKELANVLRWLPPIDEDVVGIEFTDEGNDVRLTLEDEAGADASFSMKLVHQAPLSEEERSAMCDYVRRGFLYIVRVSSEEWMPLDLPGHFPRYRTAENGPVFSWVNRAYPWEDPEYDVRIPGPAVIPGLLDSVPTLRLDGCLQNIGAVYDVLLYIARSRPGLSVRLCLMTELHNIPLALQSLVHCLLCQTKLSSELALSHEEYFDRVRGRGWWLEVTTALLSGRARGPVALLPGELIRKAMCSFLR